MSPISQHATSETEPSTRDRLERVVEVTQRMISARFDLLTLELKQTLAAALKLGVFTTVGAVLLLLGYIAGMIAAALGLARVMPAWAAVLIVAGIQFVVGGSAAAIGVALRPRPQLAIKPEEEQRVQRRLPRPLAYRQGS